MWPSLTNKPIDSQMIKYITFMTNSSTTHFEEGFIMSKCIKKKNHKCNAKHKAPALFFSLYFQVTSNPESVMFGFLWLTSDLLTFYWIFWNPEGPHSGTFSYNQNLDRKSVVMEMSSLYTLHNLKEQVTSTWGTWELHIFGRMYNFHVWEPWREGELLLSFRFFSEPKMLTCFSADSLKILF